MFTTALFQHLSPVLPSNTLLHQQGPGLPERVSDMSIQRCTLGTNCWFVTHKHPVGPPALCASQVSTSDLWIPA